MHFTDQTGYEFELIKKPVNIVSLVPSQTELLFDLGLNDEVTGITKFCIHPPHWKNTKTIVGGTKKIRMEKIQSLHPDLIIANKEENTKEEIEYFRNHYPVYTSDINDLEEALKMISDVGILVGKKVEADSLIEQIRKSFELLHISENPGDVYDNIKERVNEFESRRNQNINTGNSGSKQHDSTKLLNNQFRVAYLIWRNPYMAAGSHTFIHSMIEACGWKNALENFPRYPEVQLNQHSDIHISQNLPDLSGADIILLSSEPYPFAQKHIDEIQSFLPDKLILLVDGEIFSWYGSRLLKSADYFRSLNDQIHDLIGR